MTKRVAKQTPKQAKKESQDGGAVNKRSRTFIFFVVIIGFAVIGVFGAILSMFVKPALQDFSRPGLLAPPWSYVILVFLAAVFVILFLRARPASKKSRSRRRQ